MDASSRWARAWHTVHIGHNPLARGEDRAEAITLLLAVLIVLAALPFAAAAGSAVFVAKSERAAAEQGERYRGEATLLEDGAPLAMGGRAGLTKDTQPTEATWSTHGGEVRVGEVPASRGARAGAKVPVWLDGVGHPVASPLTVPDARLMGIGAAIALWLAAIVVSSLLYGLVRLWLDRARLSRWQEEWRATAPKWTSW
ncbi:Rv1733c family protein [Amycolatopsis alba]|uniref:Transmembrane protein n=1 Tax=Amycolatopsis alba DSM 44262 TaxID=1125972 RepID=A0A229RG81_AMYAL|nr:hypothetical protein [Amycolatopsis alba]OXM45404.1 hypothetical protein CFP75_31140 [Amycolatopsis alba DSM 44262]